MSEREGIERADTIAAAPDDTNSFAAVRPKLADRYELLGLLGSGGMGAVYRVRDSELGEIVALKMLRPEWGRNPAALERFRQEVRLARRVTHKNVARTFDIGEHEGERFLTMECVDGTSLASVIAERGPMKSSDVIAIGRAMCEGLSAAHHAGVVHRDLKPENVLIAKDGRVVVTDFGIAHASGGDESAIVGTPAYMAPEQLIPHAVVDNRADIYALGAVLYEMLAGERAWKGDAPMLLLVERARATAPPDVTRVRPDVSRALAAITTRCLAVAPEQRFASADDVARALADASDEGNATPAPLRESLPRPTHAGKTVAVLPLVNRGQEEDEYIASGLTDDLIDTLSMTRGLLVRPRGVVARFRGTDRAAPEIGHELAVQVVVEGTVQKMGTQIRVGVRAIGVEDGFQLWAQRFTAPLSDLFVVSDNAARAIAVALTTELAVHAPVAADPAAIELYLRGKEELWRSWHTSAARAVELFDRALALAPSDPKILAACAMAHVRTVFWGEGNPEETRRVARSLVQRAVQLAPDSGDAWAAAASFHLNVGESVAAAHALYQGLVRAPNFASLQDMLGRLLGELGALDEAIVRLHVALDLDPSLVSARQELPRLYELKGDFVAADRTLDAIPPGLTRDVARARICLWRGEIVRFASTAPNTYLRLYEDFAKTRRLTDEQRAFMRARVGEARARLRPLFFQRNAELFAFAGELDAAMECVDGAVKSDLIDLAWMEKCPLFTELRKDARFAPLQRVVAERAQLILAALGRA